MSRLHRLLIALLTTFENYHLRISAQYTDKSFEHSAYETSSDTEADSDYTHISSPAHSKGIVSHGHVFAMLEQIKARKSKREAFFDYLFTGIYLVQPIILNELYIKEPDANTINTALTTFILNLHALLNLHSTQTMTITVNEKTFTIHGLHNELYQGGGICASGQILQQELHKALGLPKALTFAQLDAEFISQLVQDIFCEQQYIYLIEVRKQLEHANTQLRARIPAVTQSAVAKEERKKKSPTTFFDRIFSSDLVQTDSDDIHPFWHDP